MLYQLNYLKNYTPWPESASELYRPSDRRLSAKLVPTFADRGCHVVSVTDPHGCILGFLDRVKSPYDISFVRIILPAKYSSVGYRITKD
jgi:hypothetical protein